MNLKTAITPKEKQAKNMTRGFLTLHKEVQIEIFKYFTYETATG